MTKRWKAVINNDRPPQPSDVHTLSLSRLLPLLLPLSCAWRSCNPAHVRHIFPHEFIILMCCCSIPLVYVRPQTYRLMSFEKNLELLRLIVILKYIYIYIYLVLFND